MYELLLVVYNCKHGERGKFCRLTPDLAKTELRLCTVKHRFNIPGYIVSLNPSFNFSGL